MPTTHPSISNILNMLYQTFHEKCLHNNGSRTVMNHCMNSREGSKSDDLQTFSAPETPKVQEETGQNISSNRKYKNLCVLSFEPKLLRHMSLVCKHQHWLITVQIYSSVNFMKTFEDLRQPEPEEQRRLNGRVEAPANTLFCINHQQTQPYS